jgi:hypothetical protein
MKRSRWWTFRSAQQWKRWAGDGAHQRTEVTVESGKQRSMVCGGGGGEKGELDSALCAFYRSARRWAMASVARGVKAVVVALV